VLAEPQRGHPGQPVEHRGGQGWHIRGYPVE
jgi:hypothetical protein